MWTKPSRMTRAEITQSLNDGLVDLYKVEDAAEPGHMPRPRITQKLATLRFEERVLGIRRYYAAQQAQARVDRVIRIPRAVDIAPQDVAIITAPERKQYRIELVQPAQGVYPPCVDLTLTVVEQEMTINELVR